MAKVADRPVLHSFANPWRMNVEMVCEGPSMTRGEFAEECDINTIMKNYDRDMLAFLAVARGEPQYVDFTQMPDTLQGAMNFMMEAEGAFMQLPAAARREFDNDAARFVEYAANPANIERMREWGLAPSPEPEKGPVLVKVVGEPVSSSIEPKGSPSPAKP